MIYDLNPTVRMFHRSMNDAFRNTVEHAQWMEYYKAPATMKDVVLYFVLVMVASALATAIVWTA